MYFAAAAAKFATCFVDTPQCVGGLVNGRSANTREGKMLRPSGTVYSGGDSLLLQVPDPSAFVAAQSWLVGGGVGCSDCGGIWFLWIPRHAAAAGG